MTWVDEVLAKITVGRGQFPPEIQLGKWNREQTGLRITKQLTFDPPSSGRTDRPSLDDDYADSTVQALRRVRFESSFDLAKHPAYAEALVERVFLRRSAPDARGRVMIEVFSADPSKPIDQQGAAKQLGILRPVQRYVLGLGLKRAQQINSQIFEALKDPWGFARVSIPGSIREFSVTPPIIEELPPTECEGDGDLKEFILVDGNHRVVQRVWEENRTIQAVAICGTLPQPFYARPFSKYEWEITSKNVLVTPPDTASKYAARQLDAAALSDLDETARQILGSRPAHDSYRRYFRDLTTGFGYLGGQGGRPV
jgi:hypothetical protein